MLRRSQRGRPLIPFDLEIEATLQRQSGAKKRQLQQDSTMAERNPTVLRDYVLRQATDLTSSIVNPAVKANDFKLRPAFVSFVEKDQFSGRPTENTYIHLRNFQAKCDTIKFNGVSAEAIRLRLFPFSLTDRGSDWLLNEEPNSFTT